jgi:hypothetical protein
VSSSKRNPGSARNQKEDGRESASLGSPGLILAPLVPVPASSTSQVRGGWPAVVTAHDCRYHGSAAAGGCAIIAGPLGAFLRRSRGGPQPQPWCSG